MSRIILSDVALNGVKGARVVKKTKKQAITMGCLRLNYIRETLDTENRETNIQTIWKKLSQKYNTKTQTKFVVKTIKYKIVAKNVWQTGEKFGRFSDNYVLVVSSKNNTCSVRRISSLHCLIK